MLKSTRRRLFYALVALFLVIGSGVVLYAEGWRWDFAGWRPVKVGEIYIRSYPSDTFISLGGKPIENQSGFLSRGTLIPDLLPRTYDLTITHPGYQPWHEKAAVLPAMVTEFSFTVLVPENSTTVATGSIDGFALTAAGPVLQTTHGIVARGNVSLGAGAIANADPRATSIIVRRPSGAYVLRDVAASTTVNLSALFSSNGVSLGTTPTMLINPYNATLAVAWTQSHAWIMNLATQGLSYDMEETRGYAFGESAVSPYGVAWSNFQASRNASAMQWYDDASWRTTKSSSTVPGKTVQLAYVSGSTFNILQNDGELYRYDEGSDAFTKIADAVTSFAASPDGTMLATVGRGGMEIFSSSPTDYWRFNIPNASDATELIWYRDNRHVFVVCHDHVAFLDLTDATLANFTTVAQGSSPAYDPSANALYLIDPQKHLIRFDFPQ